MITLCHGGYDSESNIFGRMDRAFWARPAIGNAVMSGTDEKDAMNDVCGIYVDLEQELVYCRRLLPRRGCWKSSYVVCGCRRVVNVVNYNDVRREEDDHFCSWVSRQGLSGPSELTTTTSRTNSGAVLVVCQKTSAQTDSHVAAVAYHCKRNDI